MQQFAYVRDGIVASVISIENDAKIEDLYHSDFVACLKEVTPEVKEGWLERDNSFEAPQIIEPSIDDLKAERIEVLRAACEAAITSGFKSMALGSTHSYPSDIKAQINLMGSVTDSLMPNLSEDWRTPFWVCDELGEWAYKLHDADQIQQAGRAGKAHVVTCQSILKSLSSAVLSAETSKDVEKIIWRVASDPDGLLE